MKKKLLFIFLVFLSMLISCKKTPTPDPSDNTLPSYLVPSWSLEKSVIGVGEKTHIILNNYDNLNDLLINVSDESLIEVEGMEITALKEGHVTITLTHKIDKNIYSKCDLDIITRPKITVEENLMVGGLYDISVFPGSLDDYEISFSSSNAKIFEGYLLCEEEGDVNLTVTSIENNIITNTISLKINPFKSAMEKPILNMTKNYIEVGSTLLIRFKNYNLIRDFDIITKMQDENGSNILSIDSSNRVVGITPTKQKIYVRHKLDHSLTASFDLSITGILPKLFISSQVMHIGDISYITISNLFETLESDVADYVWKVSDESIIKYDNGVITAVSAGSALIEVTSKYDELVKSTMRISVVDATMSSRSLILKVDGEYNGTVSPGTIYKLRLFDETGDEITNLDDYQFSSSNSEFIRYIGGGKISLVNPGYASISAYKTNNPQERATFSFRIEGTSDVDYIDNLLTIALGEKGYVERYNEETGEYVNDTKFNHWYNMEGPWCAMFVSWCWYFSGLSNDLLVKYCSCSEGKRWSEEKGIFKYKEAYHPKSGDIIFFLSAGSSHTGIVVYADDSYVYTIEGNASNRVDCWRWSLKDARITGYATPNYPSYSKPRKDYSWIVDAIYADGKYWWNNVPEKQITV